MTDEPEMPNEPEAKDGPEAPDGAEPDWPELPPYRSYSWEDEEGAVHITLYPGEEEADEERKAAFRARGARMLADLITDREAEHTPPYPGLPNLRLIRGGGGSS
ncbi:hypothetical protein [Kitasatospora sp. NPDC001547]|uniref:hypothetical protein n=1 Tax=Kitasatospora sp. NPDC001547 TaxID=3364015 RepID=UPI0036CEFC70